MNEPDVLIHELLKQNKNYILFYKKNGGENTHKNSVQTKSVFTS